MTRKQLIGFALILFGILLVLVSYPEISPWFPIIDVPPYEYLGLLSGIVGIVFVCWKDKEK